MIYNALYKEYYRINNKMVFIYVLQLDQGKYYVGKTNNPYFRLENHFNSSGSEWTKLYKPIKVLELKSNCDNYDEDKVTRQYMDKYGINNVRGGSFVSVKLEKSTIDTLKLMCNGTNDKCFICGEKGHFSKDCDKDIDEDYEEVWCCEYCGKEFMEEQKCEFHEKYCKKRIDFESDESDDDEYFFRCGRQGHIVSSCYATKHIKGYYL